MEMVSLATPEGPGRLARKSLASLSPRAPSPPLPVATLWLAAAGAFVVSLLVAPLVFHHYDVVDCFLNWARASRGRQPWAIYLTHFDTDDCDTCAEQGVLGALSATVGSFGALMAIRAIAGIGEDVAGSLFLFDGLTPDWRKMRLPKNPGCKGCG